ncbi:MAG: protein-glutamate O-methyltransferase CheR [Magnetococcales bacterium]|nr:protein-glutamate O-methyltransferase CheR [Magnetococcales bacterium]
MTPPDEGDGLQAACRVIVQRTGIVFKDRHLATLETTLRDTMERFNLPSRAVLLDRLRDSPDDASEIIFVIKRITTGESYFFRDSEQIEFLRREWLPAMIAARRQAGDLTLNLWSAGCAAGQECVTLAILLREAIPDIARWKIGLLGTDINSDALRQARTGLYSVWSMRATPESTRERHFVAEGKDWRARAELLSMIRYQPMNLIGDPTPGVAMDLILCRNVLIYFDDATGDRVLARLAGCLAPGGHLILGAAEMRHAPLPGCEIGWHGQYGYYRRPKPSDETAPPVREPEPPLGDREARVIALMRTASWRQALEAVGQPETWRSNTASLLQFRARILANMGEIRQAIDLCRASIALEATDKHVYLILALAHLEASELADAEAALRKGIFLDRKFLECHFHLGLLLLRDGRREAGLKSLRGALHHAQRSPPRWLVHHSANITLERFLPSLRAELDHYARRSHGPA